MHAVYPLVLAALLFAIGVYGLLARRNAITVLMAIELLLNAANVNLVAFSAVLRDQFHVGQVFPLFIITIAAAETGVGIAIILLVYRLRGSADVDRQRLLGDIAVDREVAIDREATDGGATDGGAATGEQVTIR